jgi:hypothetical protein
MTEGILHKQRLETSLPFFSSPPNHYPPGIVRNANAITNNKVQITSNKNHVFLSSGHIGGIK